VDVHLPGSIRTWKDFLLHLLTITIGLFIARNPESMLFLLWRRNPQN